MMLDCLVLGDSIAVGIAMNRPECVQIAHSGINSDVYIKTYITRPLLDMASYKTVIISLGTNDLVASHTESSLSQLRSRLSADKVIWILPSSALKPKQRGIVTEIALRHRDATVSIPDQWLGHDRIHPTGAGYRWIAQQTQQR